MPSERFFKLNQEKRDRILEAAVGEFSRVPYEEVSVNQIIKNAEISRGSFYTYFEDKKDILCYIFQDEGEKMISAVRESILKNGGDLWKGLEEFIRSIAAIRDKSVVKQRVNILQNTGFFQRFELDADDSFKCKSSRALQWFRQNLDPETIDLSMDDEHLRSLVGLSVRTALMSFVGIIVHPEIEEAVMKDLRYSLGFIRSGCMPRCNTELKKTEGEI